MRKFIFATFFLCPFLFCFAQTKENLLPLDSLIRFYKLKAQDYRHIDSEKATKYLHLGLKAAYKKDYDVDVGYFYRKLVSQKGYANELDSSRYFLKKGLAYFNALPKNKLSDKSIDAHLHSEIAEAYHVNDYIDSSLYHYNKATKLYRRDNDGIGVLIGYINIGNLYYEKNDNLEALVNFHEAEKLADTTQYLYIKATVFNSLVAVYDAMGNIDKSKEYAYKSLHTALQDDDKGVWMRAYLAVAKKELASGNLEEAKVHLKHTQKIIDTTGYKSFNLPLSVEHSEILLREKKYKQSKEILEKNIPLLDEFQYYPDTRFHFKYQLAKTYDALNDHIKAKSVLIPLEKLADSLNYKSEQGYINKLLSDIYLKQKNFEQAFITREIYHKISDSLMSIEKQKEFKEIETVYETEKKENQILAQKAELIEKDLQVKRKHILFLGGIALAVILGLIGFLVYNQQRLKNRQLKKESELKVALSKIETQNKLQEQRLRISRDLHDNIGSQLTFIISSLDSLNFKHKNKNQELSNKLDFISDFTTSTIYELRDTVWALNKDNISVEDLKTRIQNFLEKASVASQNTEVKFQTKGAINDQTLFTSVAGINIYRIIQESVNNAVKHASAELIEVVFKVDKQNLVVIISDNGKGFETSPYTSTNGLNNIKKRAKELEGFSKITSEKNNGTEVEVKLPLSKIRANA